MSILDAVVNGAESAALRHFAGQYEQGRPEEGYTDQEVLHRYQQVAPQLSHQEYLRAAEQAFQRMSPPQRAQFGQFLQQQAPQQHVPLDAVAQGAGASGYANNPGALAQLAGAFHQQQPGMLGQLLGAGGPTSGGGGLLSNPAAKAALAGITAMAVKDAVGHL